MSTYYQILLIISHKKFTKLNGKIVIKSVKGNSIKYKCNKDYSNKNIGELKKRFNHTFTFSNNDINNFILLLSLRKHYFLKNKNFIAI